MSNRAAQAIIERFGTAVQEIASPHDAILKVAPDQILPVLTMLKEQLRFNYLVDLTAVDDGDLFTVYYRFNTLPGNEQIVIAASVPRENPVLPSVEELWVAADWQEREIFDLMGITFTGHHNLVRVLLPDEFVGHPLRKDYVLRRAGVDD